MQFTFRPIDAWPGERTRNPRRSLFKASYSDTLLILERELDMLDASHPVIQLALREDQIRIDGLPYARAYPTEPGVILAFDSKYGPLKYATDTFDRWEDNVRAIALGLEALRKVDRYGITKRGEQYAGWKALPAAPGDDRLGRIEIGQALIAKHGSERAALIATHPDHGGDRDDYEAVQAARSAS